MKTIRNAAAVVAGFFLPVLCIAPASAQAEEWEWMLVPYLWAEDTSLDVYVNDDPIFGGDLGFDDLLDKLEFAFQLQFEGRRGKGGFFADFTTMSTSDSRITDERPPLPGGTQLDADTDIIVFEAAGFYRPSGEALGLDLLLGARVIDLDLELGLTLPPPATETGTVGTSDTFTDGFAGLRYTAPLGESWLLALRGDVGAGDSDLAWNASAYLGYNFGQRDQFAVVFGYRYLDLEFEETEGDITVETDMVMSGPSAGFMFRF